MKKHLLVVFCALLLVVVTGCGNKNQMKCTGTMNEGGVEIKAELIAEFDDNDKLSDATIIEDLGSKETADQYCGLFKLMNDADKGIEVSCSGSKVTIKGYAKIDDEEDSMIGKTREEFKKVIEEESEGKITCK